MKMEISICDFCGIKVYGDFVLHLRYYHKFSKQESERQINARSILNQETKPIYLCNGCILVERYNPDEVYPIQVEDCSKCQAKYCMCRDLK